jgi:predicted transcriptional regulator
MEWRVVKSIPMQQVQNRMGILAEKYGSLSHLHEEFTKGRMPPGIFDEYIQWTNMDHSIRAYQEGEDFEYLAEETLHLQETEYLQLTTKRLELIDFLGIEPVNSINDLAEKLGRDVKNVYHDLKILERLGFIALRKEGRSMIPEQLVYEINILLG